VSNDEAWVFVTSSPASIEPSSTTTAPTSAAADVRRGGDPDRVGEVPRPS
jgi:hypothetical protein